MNIIEVNRKQFLILQNALNCLGFVKYWGIDRFKYNKYTSKNKSLKGSVNTDICYVLGNGPSLNNVDLSLLQGKDLITVNKSINTPIFSELHPKFHIVLDPIILKEISADIERELKREDSDVIFILHRSGINQFKCYDRARFIYGTKMASDKKYFRNDMTKNMTTFLNVLPFAISCAMYFGYKKIVTLGNDFSFFASRKDQHFYECGKSERKESLYQDLAGCSIVLQEYKTLYNYAKTKGVEIVNATENSLLDELPQVSLKDYI